MEKNTFGINERLKSKKIIDALFVNKGQDAFTYPIKAVYQVLEPFHDITSPAIAVTVPKKKFKSAVARNKLKRRIKEAYRLNSHELKQFCNDHKIYLPIVFVYIATESEAYDKIENAIKRIIKNILKNGSHHNKGGDQGNQKNAL